MKKPLSLYHGQLSALYRKRREIDEDVAQVLAEAVLDGHRMIDILDHDFHDTAQEAFDL